MPWPFTSSPFGFSLFDQNQLLAFLLQESMQCSWWGLIALLPCAAASLFSSLRVPQPWHPRLARVRASDGSLVLTKRSQEDTDSSLLQTAAGCPCPEGPGLPATPVLLQQPAAQPAAQLPAQPAAAFVQQPAFVQPPAAD
ncbi:unnamed protein product, partial [Effrenium voratum]